MQLYIKLRDGFNDNTLTLKVNHHEVYKKSHLTTDLSISAADAFKLEIDNERIQFEAQLDHGVGLMQEINVIETPFLDIYLKNRKIEFHCLQQEIPML